MENVEDGTLLRIFVGEDDEHDGRPLYAVIVLALREHGLRLAGATVFRGMMGYGRSSVIHTAKVLRMSEACRSSSSASTGAPAWSACCRSSMTWSTRGLVTLEKVDIRIYRGRHTQ